MLYPRQDYQECKYFLIHEINVRHRDRCKNYKWIALGNAAYKILENIILKKIKPYIEKNTRDYQNGFTDGRSVIDNIFVLKIINKKIWEYNQSVQSVQGRGTARTLPHYLYFVLFGCYLCCSAYCLCANVYCHRVTTQLQLINISYHTISIYWISKGMQLYT